MRKIKISILIFLLVVIGGLILYPNENQAKTVITCDNCDITVTVYLAFAFLDDVSWMNAQQLVNKWVQGILAIWNEPDFTYGLCECPVHFEIVVDILPKGKDCSYAKQNMPGWHCVNVVNNPVNQRGNVADVHKTDPNNGDGFGEWTTLTTGLNAAHEFGHLMGLGEEYERDKNGNYVNINPQPEGSPQSIMAQTWGKVAALQKHIDEIIGTMDMDTGLYCPLHCCCGNETHDDFLGEECDYTATPSGCPEGQVCNTTCQCVPQPKVTPRCGDGYITGPPDGKEECDPKAKPTGCKPNEECINCKCVEMPKEIPPEEGTTMPTPVCGDGVITFPEQCDPMATPTGCEEGLECMSCKCVTVAMPSISVTPDSLDFGKEETENFFVISNTGEGTLSWEITPDLPEWLGILPMEGEVSAGGEFSVLVNIDRTGMFPGLYEHKLSITSNGGKSGVFIIMRIEEEP